jgi:hypothetical protein
VVCYLWLAIRSPDPAIDGRGEVVPGAALFGVTSQTVAACYNTIVHRAI